MTWSMDMLQVFCRLFDSGLDSQFSFFFYGDISASLKTRLQSRFSDEPKSLSNCNHLKCSTVAAFLRLSGSTRQ